MIHFNPMYMYMYMKLDIVFFAILYYGFFSTFGWLMWCTIEVQVKT